MGAGVSHARSCKTFRRRRSDRVHSVLNWRRIPVMPRSIKASRTRAGPLPAPRRVGCSHNDDPPAERVQLLASLQISCAIASLFIRLAPPVVLDDQFQCRIAQVEAHPPASHPDGSRMKFTWGSGSPARTSSMLSRVSMRSRHRHEHSPLPGAPASAPRLARRARHRRAAGARSARPDQTVTEHNERHQIRVRLPPDQGRSAQGSVIRQALGYGSWPYLQRPA